jgi:FlaA1/EpsC-like NDP-sugar epimerase
MVETVAPRSELSSRIRCVAADSVVWFVSVLAAAWARGDFGFAGVDVAATAVVALCAVAINATVGFCVHIYRRGYVAGSFDEAKMIALNVLVSASVLQCLLLLIHPSQVPRSVPIIAGASALAGMWGVRVIGRLREYRRVDQIPAENAIILGAGTTSVQLVRQMRTDATSPFHPVAVLDDDPSKRRMHIEGIAVSGTRKHLAAAALRSKASAVVIAIPDADGATIREVSTEAAALGLKTLVLPPLRELLHAPVEPRDLKEVEFADILGREPIQLDVESISNRIRGKRVLVTGAGGSIGSELCRLINEFEPSRLIMLDRDESALHAVRMSIYGGVLNDESAIALADIRDPGALSLAFAEYRPDVVFHAAALKHLPMLEAHPREAWLTNVVGTMNVLAVARGIGVSTFVNISTDKAAEPISVLGSSKRIGERLTAGVDGSDGLYVSVRFGNVLGSRGSMLPTFEAQIAAGGPVTVTHRDVTRYFMTVREACQLVLQASAIGRPGEALVLDMGVPVKIADIARLLIARSGREGIEIVYTGLRPGEEMHEDLFSADEPRNFRPVNPLISHVHVPPLTFELMGSQLDSIATPTWIRTIMSALACRSTVADTRSTIISDPVAIAG